MIIRIVVLSLFVSSQALNAQQGDCQVKNPDIADTYQGGCRNGLAHGKGIAQGTDHYEGQFNKGLPEGNGVYTWADGTYYDGQWKEGMREGKGKMVYKDSTVTGYWQQNKYIGEKKIEPYNIITSRSVARYTFSRVSPIGTEVRIKLLQGGSENLGVEDLNFSYDSGQEFRLGNTLGLQNVHFPIEVKLRYRTWNQLRTAQFDVWFEFAIIQPGTWQVMVTN